MTDSLMYRIIGFVFWALVLAVWVPSWYSEPINLKTIKENKISKAKYDELVIKNKSKADEPKQSELKPKQKKKITELSKQKQETTNSKDNTSKAKPEKKQKVEQKTKKKTTATAVAKPDNSLWLIRLICYTNLEQLQNFEEKVKEDFSKGKVLQNIYSSGSGEDKVDYFCLSIGPIISKQQAEEIQQTVDKKYYLKSEIHRY